MNRDAWVKACDQLRVADLQLEEAKRLLGVVIDQGLAHECAGEGHIAKYGCEDCKADNEAKIKAFVEGLTK